MKSLQVALLFLGGFFIFAQAICADEKLPDYVSVTVGSLEANNSYFYQRFGKLYISYQDPRTLRRINREIQGDLENRLLVYLNDDVRKPYRVRGKKIWTEQFGKAQVYDHDFHIEVDEQGKIKYVDAKFSHLDGNSIYRDIMDLDVEVAPSTWRKVPVTVNGEKTSGWIKPTDDDSFVLSYGKAVPVPLSSYLRQELNGYDTGKSNLEFVVDRIPSDGGKVIMQNGIYEARNVFPGEKPIERDVLRKKMQFAVNNQSHFDEQAPVHCNYSLLNEAVVLVPKN